MYYAACDITGFVNVALGMEKFDMIGHFSVIDYRISHRMLLIRHTEIINEKPFNTDIIFFSVFYLEIPTSFENISIKVANEDEYNYVKNRCCFTLFPDHNKVFKIISSNNTYFIGSAIFKIETNNLMPLESSIPL